MRNLVINSHAHIFPYLGGKSGWESEEAHLAALQRLFGPGGPSLGSTHKGNALHELPDVQFRIGRYGRFEWTEGGEDYYRQVMPPSLQDQTASEEYLLAQMEHAGIDIAVLQNTKAYGKLNDYFAESVRRFPSRLIGLAEIDELRADSESEILRLRRAVEQQGLKGIFYEALRFVEIGNLGGFCDKKYDSFWRIVSELGIVVYWFLMTDFMPRQSCTAQIRALSVWAERYPDIPSVVAQGLPVLPFREFGNEVRYPKEVLDVFKRPSLFLELLYPIAAGRLGWDYPFPEAQVLVKRFYELFGAQKMVWGSDMPNVERNCTYRQSLSYLTDYCDFIGREEMDCIVGGNLLRIFRIPTEVPRILLGPKRGPVM